MLKLWWFMMNSMEKIEMMKSQVSEFENMLEHIRRVYILLTSERYDNNMSRDHYMLYDTMDMFIHFEALISEIMSDTCYNKYCLEKVAMMKSYIDTLYEYFGGK
jgi:hypothetical protein